MAAIGIIAFAVLERTDFSAQKTFSTSAVRQ